MIFCGKPQIIVPIHNNNHVNFWFSRVFKLDQELQMDEENVEMHIKLCIISEYINCIL